ncbi:MAG: methyltransferase domain-containing protein [Vicinamibacteraceae bacterium]
MRAKPRGLERQYAEQFCDPSVVDAYAQRPPYPAALDPLFVELAGGADARLLDLGCGTGDLSRRLASKVRSITAVDHSDGMIARARSLPGGDAPNIAWVVGRVEDVALTGPFSSALAAQSFHWFDWAVLVRRLAAWVPTRRLILADRREAQSPWSDALVTLYRRFSTNQEFEPFDVVDELTARRYLTVEGRMSDRAQRFAQRVDDYVGALHSQNGFSRDRMTLADASAFDAAVRDAVAPHARDGVLMVAVTTRVVWGRVEGTES